MARIFMGSLLLAGLVCPAGSPAYAASTGSVDLFMPQGSGTPRASGDFITSNNGGGLNTLYHYFIEVPPGLARLRIQLFDADIGAGGAAEAAAQRDRGRGNAGSFSPTTANYSLVDPSGTSRLVQFTVGDNTQPAGADGAWLTLYDGRARSVADNFGTVAFTNNDGTNNWSAAWVETDAGGAGAATGSVLVAGGQLRIHDNVGGNPALARQADLSATGLNLATAWFSFDWGTSGNLANGDQINVDVSNNGGTTYTTLETLTTASTGTHRDYNITSFIANNTRIRFIVSGGLNNNARYYSFDNVQIHDGGAITAGHWDLRIDETSAVTTGDDINALGVRADDGDATSGGTEIPVYYDSVAQYGNNPPATGQTSRDYRHYPYFTGGCTARENDFDYDSNQTDNVGTIAFTSRSTATSQSIVDNALSQNNVWKQNTINGWTTDTDSTDYGIWQMDLTINSYNDPGTGINGNYTDVYVGNSSVVGTPPANPITSNVFRVYLPTDAGGAPSKPYVEQLVRYSGCATPGPNPPQVGQTSCFTVTVRVVNPTAQSIAFSATNLVTATIPGAGATYQGNAAVGQGTVTAQPAVGGTGVISWNPGTVAAGVTTSLKYQVKVLPTSAGQRIPVTGTVAAGTGTTARYVDETGNTTQTRATYTFGQLCELAVTAGLVTPAVVADVRATSASRGGVILEWNTVSEVGTVAFDVLRWDAGTRRYLKVNDRPLPALLGQPQGGHYRYLDASASKAVVNSYLLVEYEASGATRQHGPFRVAVARQPGASSAAAAAENALGDGDFSSSAKPRQPALTARAAAVAKAGGKALPVLGSTQVMVGVRNSGVYRIGADDISNIIGLPFANVRKDIANHTFRLTLLGAEVGWIPGADYNSILFYGQQSSSPFAAENVYLLKRRNGTPPAAAANLGAAPGSTATVRAAVHAEEQKLAATVVSTDPQADFWFWDYLQAGAGPKSFALSLPAAVSAGGSAHLHVALHGATSTGVTDEHHAVVSLNGVEIGEVRWTGLESAAGDFDVSESVLQPGTNAVAITGVLDSGAPYSFFYLDSIDATYDRSPLADADSLAFAGDGFTPVTITGFSSPRITVLDVTDPAAPAPVAATIDLRRVGSTVSLTPAAGARYLAFADSAVRAPVWLGGMPESTLLDGSHAADEVMLVPDALLSAVQPLADWRRSQGLKVEVVSLQDVWNAFNFGMPNPAALRDFLAATRSSWSTAPRFVLLAGGGTFDYRDYLGYGGNLLPPMMISTEHGLFASDAAIADFDGDGVADMEVGRLPANSPSELSAMVNKIIGYESTAYGPWVGRALLLADADAQTDFVADSHAMTDVLPAAYDKNRFELDTEPVQQAHDRLLAAFTGGAAVLNYVGHSGLDRLSAQGLLLSDDVPALANGLQTPVVTAFTCVVNRFEVPGFQPIGAQLARRQQGGAVAVLAPSGESQTAIGRQFGRAFYGAWSNDIARLGDVIQRARRSVEGMDGASSSLPVYNLLGDPALLLRRPQQVTSVPAGRGSSKE